MNIYIVKLKKNNLEVLRTDKEGVVKSLMKKYGKSKGYYYEIKSVRNEKGLKTASE